MPSVWQLSEDTLDADFKAAAECAARGETVARLDAAIEYWGRRKRELQAELSPEQRAAFYDEEHP